MPHCRHKCQYCPQEVDGRALKRHEETCRSNPENIEARERDDSFLEQLRDLSDLTTYIQVGEEMLPTRRIGPDSTQGWSANSTPKDPTLDGPPAPPKRKYKNNDIRRTFHPLSGRESQVLSFDEYCDTLHEPCSSPCMPTEYTPWEPFVSLLDYEIAKLAHETRMNKKQTEQLLRLFHRTEKEKFTITSYRQLEDLWGKAETKLEKFQSEEVQVFYQGHKRSFSVIFRPLWTFAMELVQDEHLAHLFAWDAEQVDRFQDGKFVRVVHDPCTGQYMWDEQDTLESVDDKILPYIIYADKSKLSSFGTQKGYPVIARLANIAVDPRNTTKWGGGQIVGWLPIVPDEESERDKPEFANFKAAVWHASMHKVIQSLIKRSKHGEWVDCGDGIWRRFFPKILILAADYEELATMTLIRGTKANFPCPVCHIKRTDIPSGITARLRTASESKGLVTRAKGLGVVKAEKLLRDNGLRLVDNVFWLLKNCNPHKAASFESLHAFKLGLFGKHLFVELKSRIKQLPGRMGAQVDKGFAALPRWPNLNHFDQVMGITFNDGTKFEDVAKMIILVTYHLFEEDEDIALLELIRKYQVMSTLCSFEVHTQHTIQSGENASEEFYKILSASRTSMQVSSSPCFQRYQDAGGEKDWAFPKAHSFKHLWDDLRNKGASRNFGTKMDEAMHRSTRENYHQRTNFKNVGPQILKAEFRTLITKFIQTRIDHLFQFLQEPTESNVGETTSPTPRVELGSNLRPTFIGDLESKSGPAFTDLSKKINTFLTKLLGRETFVFNNTKITPHQLVKVHFQSLANWTRCTDHLRCNNLFHGRPRFDAALLQSAEGVVTFVQLLGVFTVSYQTIEYSLALVHALDAQVSPLNTVEKALDLIRIRKQPVPERSKIISVDQITRGAYLVKDSRSTDGLDYLVSDLVDGDMYLRLGLLRPSGNGVDYY